MSKRVQNGLGGWCPTTAGYNPARLADDGSVPVSAATDPHHEPNNSRQPYKQQPQFSGCAQQKRTQHADGGGVFGWSAPPAHITWVLNISIAAFSQIFTIYNFLTLKPLVGRRAVSRRWTVKLKDTRVLLTGAFCIEHNESALFAIGKASYSQRPPKSSFFATKLTSVIFCFWLWIAQSA